MNLAVQSNLLVIKWSHSGYRKFGLINFLENKTRDCDAKKNSNFILK